MELSGLIRALAGIRHELAAVGADAKSSSLSAWDLRELTLEVGLQVAKDAEGQERLVLLEGTPPSGSPGSLPSHHKLVLKLAGTVSPENAGVSASRKRTVGPDSVIIADADSEAGAGGDEATLLRRLEIVLGGPPGFTTGAKAEILADLLREFGRAALVENLQRVWVSQFDTGADSSPSVSKG